jgi:HSP20 family protein
MLITRYDPFKALRDVEDRIYNRFYNDKEEGISSFTPKVNTREGEFAYHVDVDLPGVDKDNIKVDVKDNVLTISGERSTKKEIKEEDYLKVETSFGKFSRSFTLSDDIDSENITASAENGVLEVILPKVKQITQKSKQIKVS